jgi:hypothetical protein
MTGEHGRRLLQRPLAKALLGGSDGEAIALARHADQLAASVAFRRPRRHGGRAAGRAASIVAIVR